MDVRSLAVPALTPTGGPATVRPTGADGVASFGQLFADALHNVQHTQTEADTLASALAAGQDVELHEVVLALEQASLATQLTVQVRNKLVEAYQEIARMQV